MQTELECSPRNSGIIIAVVVVFALQLAGLFWMGRPARRPERTAHQMAISLANDVPAELISLSDPSVFGLPRAEGFSGSAWLHSFSPPERTYDWNEPPRWLPVSFQPFSVVVTSIREHGVPGEPEPVDRPIPQPVVPGTVNADFLPQGSTLTVLEATPGLNTDIKVELPSWTSTDLISNSVVQAVVDSAGKVISTVLLSSSGLRAADDFALKATAGMNFSSQKGSPGQGTSKPEPPLHWVQLSFDWLTLAPESAAPAR